MAVQIPAKPLESREWRAALLILAHTTIKKFFTTEFVDLEHDAIDFRKMRRAATSNSERCLIDLAAHLFNVWQFPKFPGEAFYNLDGDNKAWGLLAMMERHGVHPDDVAHRHVRKWEFDVREEASEK
jgi:hypothetical protein